MTSRCAAFLALLLAMALPVLAAEKNHQAGVEASATNSQGKIALADGVASVNLPPAYRFIGPSEAKRVLLEEWGYVPARHNDVLGLVIPSTAASLADAPWGIVLGFNAYGHLDDSEVQDVATWNTDQLLKEMKQKEAKDRKKRGAQADDIRILSGWAELPRYAKPAHMLTWAEELKLAGSTSIAAAYSTRILGRKGILFIDALGSIKQFDDMRAATLEVSTSTAFNAGHRYADFDGRFDRLADFDLMALVRGVGPRTSSANQFITGLRNFNVFYIALAIGGVIAIGLRLRALLKKTQPLPRVRPPI